MYKYKQDEDKQLQRLRKALPKGSFWPDQVRPSKKTEQAWKILDTEFGDQRKLMDTLLSKITSLKPMKNDWNSLSRYAARIISFVNNMEQTSCAVTSTSEAPFVKSQLLSKLDASEMLRMGKGENVLNLIDWLNKEARLRSRIKRDTNYRNNSREHRSDNNANDSGLDQDEKCPLGCKTKHLLSACPMYQKSTVDEKWEIVKQNNRCRKCLRAHHTNSCKKPDGTTCDKCTRRHHRSLHNERVPLANSDQGTETLPSANESQEASNHNVQGETSVPAICPVQKVKIRGQNGNFTEALAMLDSGSNTSFISKNVVKKLGISVPKTHLTMNFAGGQTKSEASEFLDITVVSLNQVFRNLCELMQ